MQYGRLDTDGVLEVFVAGDEDAVVIGDAVFVAFSGEGFDIFFAVIFEGFEDGVAVEDGGVIFIEVGFGFEVFSDGGFGEEAGGFGI